MCVPTLSCMVSSLSCISLRSPSMSVLREEMALSLFLTSTPSCWFLSFNCRISSWRLVTWWGGGGITTDVLSPYTVLYVGGSKAQPVLCTTVFCTFFPFNAKPQVVVVILSIFYSFFLSLFVPTLLHTLRVQAHTHNM